jgi:hypothetical protein
MRAALDARVSVAAGDIGDAERDAAGVIRTIAVLGFVLLRTMRRVVHPPVIVHASPQAAAELLAELLGEDYGALVKPGDGNAAAIVSVEPIDEQRRGVVLYRVIQASRNVAEQLPDAEMFLLTEEGSRWRLPPPAI